MPRGITHTHTYIALCIRAHTQRCWHTHTAAAAAAAATHPGSPLPHCCFSTTQRQHTSAGVLGRVPQHVLAAVVLAASPDGGDGAAPSTAFHRGTAVVSLPFTAGAVPSTLIRCCSGPRCRRHSEKSSCPISPCLRFLDRADGGVAEPVARDWLGPAVGGPARHRCLLMRVYGPGGAAVCDSVALDPPGSNAGGMTGTMSDVSLSEAVVR